MGWSVVVVVVAAAAAAAAAAAVVVVVTRRRRRRRHARVEIRTHNQGQRTSGDSISIPPGKGEFVHKPHEATVDRGAAPFDVKSPS